MFAFFRRLTGTDDRVKQEEEKLAHHLSGMDRQNAELARLERHLEQIMERVESQGIRQRRALPSGASGEHHLDLPPEFYIHGPTRGSLPDV